MEISRSLLYDMDLFVCVRPAFNNVHNIDLSLLPRELYNVIIKVHASSLFLVFQASMVKSHSVRSRVNPFEPVRHRAVATAVYVLGTASLPGQYQSVADSYTRQTSNVETWRPASDILKLLQCSRPGSMDAVNWKDVRNPLMKISLK